jgi:myo-inositol catabolism protein IolH
MRRLRIAQTGLLNKAPPALSWPIAPCFTNSELWLKLQSKASLAWHADTRCEYVQMRIALDPYMHRRLALPQVFRLAAELEYPNLELSSRQDFVPLFEAPVATSETIRAVRAASRESGVKLASIMAVYYWANPDQEKRRTAVEHWKRAIRVAVEADCRVINSEFSGHPDEPDVCKDAFLASIGELLPILEREGIRVDIEPHPGDFVEDGNTAVDILREIGSPHLRYLYCAPHTFFLGEDMAGMIRYAAPLLTHVHVADSLNHRAGLRYIVNPLGAPVRVHQHLNIGEGEVNWEIFFGTLAEVGFGGILTSSIFAWEDRAIESSRFMRKRIQFYLDKYMLT